MANAYGYLQVRLAAKLCNTLQEERASPARYQPYWKEALGTVPRLPPMGRVASRSTSIRTMQSFLDSLIWGPRRSRPQCMSDTRAPSSPQMFCLFVTGTHPAPAAAYEPTGVSTVTTLEACSASFAVALYSQLDKACAIKVAASNARAYCDHIRRFTLVARCSPSSKCWAPRKR